MKRIIMFTSILALLACFATLVMAEENIQEVFCEEQGFSTKIPQSLTAYWEDGNGLRINVGKQGYVPFVLIWRTGRAPGDGTEYLNGQFTREMEEQYGDNLIARTYYETYDIGGKSLPAALFTYKVEGGTLCLLRLEEVLDDQTVEYTAKYINGDPDATMEALDLAVRYYQPDQPDEEYYLSQAKSVTLPDSEEENGYKVIPSDASLVSYVSFLDPSGYFTMDIPEGWKVETGLKPDGVQDLVSYAVCLFDPTSPDRMMYFNLNNAGMLKSQEAHDWYVRTYGADSYFAQSPVATEVSVKGFFEGMSGLYDYSSFTVRETAGTNALGAEVMRADIVSTLTGNPAEGLFSAILMDTSYPVQKDPFDFSAGTVDAGILTMFDVVMETAPSGEFIDWQPVLDHCLASISFTQDFLSQRAEAWKQVMGTSEMISHAGNEVSDMIMDTWENSTRSSDLLSQKQSDAALGYERVYDTESGEYLKAETGFTDWYDGNRYTSADNDEAYLSPVSGTIIWK